MSENTKASPSCLHCSTNKPNLHYQAIYDDVGIQIGLADLMSKFYKINVTSKVGEAQLLCEDCVSSLIQLYDIDELEKQRNAAKTKPPVAQAARSETKQQQSKLEAALKSPTKAVPTTTVAVEASPAKERVTRASISARIVAKSVPAKITANLEKPSKAVKSIVTIAEAEKPKVKKLVLPRQTTITKVATKRKNTEPSKVTPNKEQPETSSSQDDITVLMQNILAEDGEGTAINAEITEQKSLPKTFLGNDETYYNIEKLEIDISEELEGEFESIDSDEANLDELKIDIVGAVPVKKSESINSEDSANVDPFVFLPIKEKDDVGDLYDYLETAVKTSFETLTFDWKTACQHCTFKCSNFQSLLTHALKCKKASNGIYKCPINDCTQQLKGRKKLAMHLVVQHAVDNNVPIYGSCPECLMTFSNLMTYNKHSCAHIFKKKRGAILHCQLCAVEFPSWKRYLFHTQFHFEKHRPKACFICNYVEYDLDKLFHHLNYAHEPSGTLFCTICDRMFRDPQVFEEHKATHTVSGTYTCNECGVTFETRGRLNGHMRTQHGALIYCELCSKEFSTETTFNIHMRTHLIIQRELYVCTNCNKLSDSHERIQEHVENEEVGSCYGVEVIKEVLRDAYICEYCSAYFKTKDALRVHRESGIHKDGLFWCEPCFKHFTHVKLYRHHLRQQQKLRTDTAHRKMEMCIYYMCDYENCDESYVNWNSLYTHKRRTHDIMKAIEASPAENTTKVEEKDKAKFICQFCKKECQTKMSLAIHVARSHNNNNLVCPLCKASYKNEELLQKHHEYWHEPTECPTCLKVVKNRRNYETHVNVVHSKKKRYHCSICKKGFYHKSEMTVHERLHTEAHGCEICNFTTRNKASLDLHMLVQHFKKYPFECKVCKKGFGRKQGLTYHMQRTHGEKHRCRDFFANGCSKIFGSMTHLSTHVRKVHKSTIQLEELDDESSNEVPDAKRRCFKIDDMRIEFIGIDDDEIENDTANYEVIDDDNDGESDSNVVSQVIEVLDNDE